MFMIGYVVTKMFFYKRRYIKGIKCLFVVVLKKIDFFFCKFLKIDYRFLKYFIFFLYIFFLN